MSKQRASASTTRLKPLTTPTERKLQDSSCSDLLHEMQTSQDNAPRSTRADLRSAAPAISSLKTDH